MIFKDHDGSFQAPPDQSSDATSACRRIGLAVRLLQAVMADTISAETGLRRTFTCAGDSPVPLRSQPYITASPLSAAVWCVRSRLTLQKAQSLSSLRLWVCLAKELDGIFVEDRDKGKWLAVVSCTEFRPVIYPEVIPETHEDALARTKGYCAMGKVMKYT